MIKINSILFVSVVAIFIAIYIFQIVVLGILLMKNGGKTIQ